MKSLHARLPDVLALMCIGMKEGLTFAVGHGAILQKNADLLLQDARVRFIEAAAAQGGLVEEERPGNTFWKD
jgi:hypothetical protein